MRYRKRAQQGVIRGNETRGRKTRTQDRDYQNKNRKHTAGTEAWT